MHFCLHASGLYIVQGRKRHLVANSRDREGPLCPSSALVVKAVPEWLCLWWPSIVIMYLTSALLLMLSVAMVMGYNCRAMTLHAECGFVRKAQCSSHKIMVHRRRVTAEIFENSTVACGSSCVYCTPSAYELNRPLACKLYQVLWNAGDVTSGSVFAAIFHRIIGKMSVPFVWCLCMPESCHLPRVCEHAESVKLTFGNGAQNVRIGHSESEMKEIHCSNCDAMWWKHTLTA